MLIVCYLPLIHRYGTGEEDDGVGDVSRADRPTECAIRREAIERARIDIIACIGDVDVAGGRMDGNAIGFDQCCAVGDEGFGDQFAGANVYYAVGYFVFVCDITILRTAEIEGVARDAEIADGDVNGVDGVGVGMDTIEA